MVVYNILIIYLYVYILDIKTKYKVINLLYRVV